MLDWMSISGPFPPGLESIYGTRPPVGAFFFVGLQPAQMPTSDAHMSGM